MSKPKKTFLFDLNSVLNYISLLFNFHTLYEFRFSDWLILYRVILGCVACEQAPGEVGKKFSEREKKIRGRKKKFGERDSASEASALSARPARPRLHSAISPSTQPGPITGPGYLALNPAGSLFAGYGL